MAEDAPSAGGPVTAAGSLDGLLVEQAGVAIMATARDGTITHWNAAAEELFGWGHGDVLGRDLTSLLGPPPGASDGLVGREEAVATFVIDATLPRADGSEVVCRLAQRPLLDEQLGGVGAVLVAF